MHSRLGHALRQTEAIGDDVDAAQPPDVRKGYAFPSVVYLNSRLRLQW